VRKRSNTPQFRASVFERERRKGRRGNGDLCENRENQFAPTLYIGALSTSPCPSRGVVNLRLQLLRIPLTVIVRISHDPCTMRTGFGKRRKGKLYSRTVNAAPRFHETRRSRFSCLASLYSYIYHQKFQTYGGIAATARFTTGRSTLRAPPETPRLE